jgi:hypothetical protein
MTHDSQPVMQQGLMHLGWTARLRDALAFGLMRLALFLTGNRY